MRTDDSGIPNKIVIINSCVLEGLRLAIKIGGEQAHQDRNRGWFGDWLHLGPESLIKKTAQLIAQGSLGRSFVICHYFIFLSREVVFVRIKDKGW
jgi:hypothetical protein